MPPIGTGSPAHDANAAGYYGGVAEKTKDGEKKAKDEKKKEKKGFGAGGMLLAGGAGLAGGALLANALRKFRFDLRKSSFLAGSS